MASIKILSYYVVHLKLLCSSNGKESGCNAGDQGSISGLGSSSGEGNGNPLQASLTMEFSRQEYWSGLPFPSPEELPNTGIEPWFPAWQADSLPFELQGSLMCV